MSRIAQQFFLSAVVVMGAATMSACGAAGVSASAQAPGSSAVKLDTQEVAATTKTAPKQYTSDVSQLKDLGVSFNSGALIDVADDGLDRYMNIDRKGNVNFSGTSKNPNTEMSLQAAKVTSRSLKNRILIKPSWWNEDLGPGSCVADLAKGHLALATCSAKAANQIWHAVPAGDSGQFELHGKYTYIHVNKGKLNTNGKGFTGLQTIKFS